MRKSVFYSHIVTMAQQESISIEEALRYARSVGYEGLDTDWAELSEDPHGFLSRIHAADLQIASVNVFCDFTHTFSPEDMQEILSTIRSCGCKKAMIIPGFYSSQGSREAELPRVIDALRQTCAMGDALGMTISIEDFDNPLSPCGSIEDVGTLLEAVPGLMHTFDTGNYAFFGQDMRDALKRYADRIVHVHLKDRTNSAFLPGEEPILSVTGAPLYSAPVGCGFIPIGECLAVLKSRNYEGYLSAEFFGASDMRAYLARSSDNIDRMLAE